MEPLAQLAIHPTLSPPIHAQHVFLLTITLAIPATFAAVLFLSAMRALILPLAPYAMPATLEHFAMLVTPMQAITH